MLTLVVFIVVSGALTVGAAWGIYGTLPEPVEGFLVAVAGGALLVSAVLELIEPSTKQASLLLALAVVGVGAVVFSLLDKTVKEKWGSDSGGGLLAAITLDGIPENLALGVALIGAGPKEVAALSGAILLSNLPEAAGGAKQMSSSDRSNIAVFGLWTGAAVLLSMAALIGNLAFANVSQSVLAYVRCFAGGAVVASLATEVFPRSVQEGQLCRRGSPPRSVCALRSTSTSSAEPDCVDLLGHCCVDRSSVGSRLIDDLARLVIQLNPASSPNAKIQRTLGSRFDFASKWELLMDEV